MLATVRNSVRWTFTLVATVLVASLLGSPALGQTADDWLNPNGGSYENGANWSLRAPGAYPVFNLGSAGYTINLTQNEAAADPFVETDNPTISLNSSFYSPVFLDVDTAAGTNGSLTFLGPGTVDAGGQDNAYIDVGNASSTGQLIINGASVTQGGLQAGLNVAGGSTLTVENGGSVVQNDLAGQFMSIANLVVNSGTVSTEGSMNLGSATITNGASVTPGIGGPLGNLNVSGNILINDSSVNDNGDFIPTAGAALTVTNGGFLNSNFELTLPATTDLVAGLIIAPNLTFGSNLAMQLDIAPVEVDVEGRIQNRYSQIGTGGPLKPSGTLNLVFPSGFAPMVGDQFQLFAFGDGVIGAFSQINTPALPSGESWDLSDIYTNGNG